jgi:hypothetical protein
MDKVFSSQLDLTHQPFGNSDIDYFTDGSSFTSYVVVTLD